MPRAIKWPPKDLEEGGTLEVKISAKLSSKNDRWVAADGSEDGARQFEQKFRLAVKKPYVFECLGGCVCGTEATSFTNFTSGKGHLETHIRLHHTPKIVKQKKKVHSKVTSKVSKFTCSAHIFSGSISSVLAVHTF